MKRKGLMIIAVLAILASAFGFAHALGSYWSSFKSTYSTSPLTQAPMIDASGRNCLVCHAGWPGTSPSVSTVNSYGNAYANNGYVFDATLDALDSDGDGYTNLQEIQAGTYPGDPASHPSPADTTPPIITSFVVPSTSSSLTVSVSMAATDNVGVTGYMLTTTSTVPLAAATGWSATTPTSYTFSSAGSKTLYGWAKDGAGNVSAPASATVTITLPDTTPPTITSFVVPSASSSLTASVSMAATDNVGVTGYMLTTTSTAPSGSATGWSATAPTSYAFSSAGAKTLYGWAKDAAGNVSAPGSGTVTITLPDTTPPTVTSFSIPASASSLTVSVSMSATDDTGVTGYMLTTTSTAPLATATGWSATAPTSYAFSSAGVKNLYGWAKDAAGNVSAPGTGTVTITLPDTTPPQVTSFIVPATASSLTISVSMAATDNVSVTGYMLTETPTAPAASASGWSPTAPTSYSFASASTHTLYAWAKDGSGNVSTSMNAAVAITLADVTPPVVTSLIIPPSATSLTVTVSMSATDNLGVTGYMLTEASAAPVAPAAGWSPTAPTSYTFGSAGAKTLYGWAKDAAGNVSTSMSQTVTVTVSDATTPVITKFVVSARPSSLTALVTLSASDDVGVAGYYVSETATQPSPTAPGWTSTAPASYTFKSAGYKTLYAWAKDAAGNISARASQRVVIHYSGRRGEDEETRSSSVRDD